MLRRVSIVLAAIVLVASVARGAEPVIRWVDFEGKFVLPGFSDRILRAIDEADANQEDLIVIQLDTPGGAVDTMQEIVKRMLAAKTPIVVWVGPSGASAGSAGFFILVAADVAAMAPGTRAGAASVVHGSGKSEDGDVSLRKATQDLAALARTIAEHRGRNVEACEQAVLSAESYTDGAAVDKGIVDLVAKDREELLDKLEGRPVKRFDGELVTLRTVGARIVTTHIGAKNRFLETVGSPLVAGFLLLLGVGGLYVELTHPGLVFPGVVGALALLLFALAAQVLPVSTLGLLLILLALVMFLLEIKVTSYGMLGFGGAVTLVIGALMVFDGPIPELRLPLAVVLPPALALALFCALAVRWTVAAQRSRVGTGSEGLVGEEGDVTEDLQPAGRVFVHGELWNAVSAGGPLPKGSRIRVVGIEDLRLTVEDAARSADGGNQ